LQQETEAVTVALTILPSEFGVPGGLQSHSTAATPKKLDAKRQVRCCDSHLPQRPANASRALSATGKLTYTPCVVYAACVQQTPAFL